MYIVHYLVPAKKVFEPIILLWTNHAVIFTVATQKSCKFLFLIIFRMDNLFIYSLGGITVWQVSPQEILADDVVYIVYKRQDMSFCDVMSEYNLVLQACVSQWDCVPSFVTIALRLGYPILAGLFKIQSTIKLICLGSLIRWLTRVFTQWSRRLRCCFVSTQRTDPGW